MTLAFRLSRARRWCAAFALTAAVLAVASAACAPPKAPDEKQAGQAPEFSGLVVLLVVHTILVDEGTSMWRIRARAHGRAAWINKRTSNITVVLAER